jgi:hypothetical protein
MDLELYTAKQLADVEKRLSTVEAQAIGGPLWSWRFESSGDGACFALGERPGGPRAWASAIRTEILVSGAPISAAQVVGGDLARPSGDEAFDRALFEALFSELRQSGVKMVYGSIEPRSRKHFAALGFFPLAEVAVRSLYLGLGISRRIGRDSFNPLRAIAREAARIRTKLVEVELDAEHLKRFSQGYALRRREHSFGIGKSESYLRWRYLQDPRVKHRAFVHRRKTGLGLDGFVIVRVEENERGRVETHVLDHWSREAGRRAHAVFLGEVSLWAMTEGTEVLRGFAVAGSNIEQALIGMGGVRKKAERLLVLKRISDDGPAPESLDPTKVALRAGDLELFSSIALPAPRRQSSVPRG